MSLGITAPSGKDGSRERRMNNKCVPMLWLGFAAWIVLAPVVVSAGAGEERSPEGCTVIEVGRLATVDGSVFTSHTDYCSECRVHVVPGRTFKSGQPIAPSSPSTRASWTYPLFLRTTTTPVSARIQPAGSWTSSKSISISDGRRLSRTSMRPAIRWRRGSLRASARSKRRPWNSTRRTPLRP